MNVHVKIEVLDRELEGRLLLALAAAERGHDVWLGDLRPLLVGRVHLPAGVFHDKSLSPSDKKVALLTALRARGSRITSQDEEHGLALDDHTDFVRSRYSERTLALADRAFAWGPFDTESMNREFPAARDRIVMTGSPRVDTWRREIGAAIDVVRPLPRSADRPYVLVVSSLSPFARNRFWVTVRDMRPTYFPGPDDPREFAMYADRAAAYRYAGRLVRAVRLLARELPGVDVVIRPHPMEADGAWQDAVGAIPNVTVVGGGAVGAWVRGAAAVVHNGSTVAFEAAVSGTPVVSFQPDGIQSDRATNRVGTVAPDEASLCAIVGALVTAGPTGIATPGDDPVLASRFAALTGRLAADRIVDAWEELDVPGEAVAPRAAVGRLIVTAARAEHGLRALRHGGSRRRRGPAALQTAHKFPPFDVGTVRDLVRAYRTALDRFASVEVARVGPRLLRLRAGIGSER